MDEKPTLPPKGSDERYAYNRLNETFIQQFDGIFEFFDPHETKVLKDGRAEFFHKQFLIPGTLSYGQQAGRLKAEHVIVLDGDESFQVPYTGPVGAELFSPSMDNYAEKGTGGLKTTRKLVHL